MENERPIEKLLRRYAEKRSDEAGAPPELHPATRRLLQGEVKRRYPQAGTERRAGFWPRWRLALGVIALLAVVATIFIPTLARPKLEAARLAELNKTSEAQGLNSEPLFDDGTKASAPPASSLSSPLPATPPASAAPGAQAADASVVYGGVDRKLSVSGYVSATNGILPPVAESPAEPPAFPVGGPMTTAGQTVALAEKTQPVTLGPNGAVDFTDSFKYTNNLAAAGESSLNLQAVQKNISQNFRNNAVVDKDLAAAKTANAVLNNFNCEQDGDHLIVVDGDGSTYSGSIELAQAVTTFAGSAVRAKVDGITSQAPQNYFFRVVGTNRTLNANVTFTGNLLPQANATKSEALTSETANQAQNGVQQQSFPELQNATIIGRARVGDQIVVDVNAVPVSQ